MNTILSLSILFTLGSISGWVLEFIYRRMINKKWINPGALNGTYLPLYGFGLCFLYIIDINMSQLSMDHIIIQKIILYITMSISMTILEYITGLIFIKKEGIKLWDYSKLWGNYQGIICPLYSFFWTLLAIFYDVMIHPYIQDILFWFSNNLAYIFFIGMFYGIFIIDVIYSLQIINRIHAFAQENKVIIQYDQLKEQIHAFHSKHELKSHLLLPFSSNKPLHDHLKDMIKDIEQYIKK